MAMICLYRQVDGEELTSKQIEGLIKIFCNKFIDDLKITDTYKKIHMRDNFLVEYNNNEKNEIVIVFKKPSEVEGRYIINIVEKYIGIKFIKEIKDLYEIEQKVA